MHFSLVLSTFGRTKEVEKFLTSLADQSHRDFDLIVVDQNSDDGLVSLIETYQVSFTISHLRRPDDRGLSKARNVGLQHVIGDIVTCPDDDCWYPAQLLEQVDRCLTENPKVDVISSRTSAGPEKASEDNQLPSLHQLQQLTSPIQVMRVPGMWALFLRNHTMKSVGTFDETLGVGAGTPWGAAEDTDYYLRLLKAGFTLYASPRLVVFHPTASDEQVMLRDLGRSYRYGAGATRVWRRHGLPLWYFLYELLRSFAGVPLSLLRGRRAKACWHWGAFRGKLRGWFSR